MDKEHILSKEEENIFRAIESAREIQDFLWGDQNNQWDLEEWKRMFRKRVAKIDEIDEKNPHSKVELKKRLLQTAAVSINLLTRLDLDIMPKNKSEIPSNLEEYRKKEDS